MDEVGFLYVKIATAFLKCLINVHNGKLRVIWLTKKDNLMLLSNQFNAFSSNLNAQHVNGMTRFDLVRLLDTLE